MLFIVIGTSCKYALSIAVSVFFFNEICFLLNKPSDKKSPKTSVQFFNLLSFYIVPLSQSSVFITMRGGS